MPAVGQGSGGGTTVEHAVAFVEVDITAAAMNDGEGATV